MVALGKDLSLVSQYIRSLRGGSQPFLAQATDGFQYVVKFANNLQGPDVLFNECAGNELYRACGLLVPEWKLLWVSDSFLDRNRSCWIQTPAGRLRPAAGFCFGSLYLGLNGKRLLEILPGSMLKRVRNRCDFWLAWLIDVCAEHVDNRQAIFGEDADGRLDAHFIDHGHMFGGPTTDLKKVLRDSCIRDFRAPCYLDRRIYGETPSEELRKFQQALRAMDFDKLRQRIEAIPAEWSPTLAHENIERCLQKLATGSHVQHVIDEITDDLEQRTETQSGNSGIERKPPSAVLRRGLHGAGFGQGRAHLPHCA
jgi:hypothetical protein